MALCVKTTARGVNEQAVNLAAAKESLCIYGFLPLRVINSPLYTVSGSVGTRGWRMVGGGVGEGCWKPSLMTNGNNYRNLSDPAVLSGSPT